MLILKEGQVTMAENTCCAAPRGGVGDLPPWIGEVLIGVSAALGAPAWRWLSHAGDDGPPTGPLRAAPQDGLVRPDPPPFDDDILADAREIFRRKINADARPLDSRAQLSWKI